MFAAADVVTVNFALQNIGPVERLLGVTPGRTFRQMSCVIKQRLWFSHRFHPYKKSQRVSPLALIIYGFPLLPVIIRLTQQRPTFALEALGIIAKPVLHFAEAVDKRLFIPLLQQANRFTKTLVVAFNQRQIVFR